jgi:hypothetical protein
VGRGLKMDFQVHEQTYFINLAEENQWEVLMETPSGVMPIPVYVDAGKTGSLVMLPEDGFRMPN